PGSPFEAVSATVAGRPPRCSTHWRIFLWSVVVFASELIAHLVTRGREFTTPRCSPKLAKPVPPDSGRRAGELEVPSLHRTIPFQCSAVPQAFPRESAACYT